MLEDFWLARQELELPGSARPKSAPTPCRVNDRSASTPRDRKARSMKLATGKVGVLECIDGVLRGATLGALDSAANVPVLLVTSTVDALDSSNTAEVSRLPNLSHVLPTNGAPNESIVSLAAFGAGLLTCECCGTQDKLLAVRGSFSLNPVVGTLSTTCLI